MSITSNAVKQADVFLLQEPGFLWDPATEKRTSLPCLPWWHPYYAENNYRPRAVIYISQHCYQNYKIEQVESVTDEDMVTANISDYTIVKYLENPTGSSIPTENTRAPLFSLAQG